MNEITELLEKLTADKLSGFIDNAKTLLVQKMREEKRARNPSEGERAKSFCMHSNPLDSAQTYVMKNKK